MKKATTILLLLFGFWSMSAQIPAFSATTTWRVADGNNTWVGTALQNKTYLAAGTLSKVDDTNIECTSLRYRVLDALDNIFVVATTIAAQNPNA